jgi:drug/metabolite transporter (DMT)-like permease
MKMSGAAPALFVLLWATGFIGARYAMPWCEPFLFLSARFAIAGAIIGAVAIISGVTWPSRTVALHAAISGSLIHGIYLGAVFWAIRNGLPAGMSALIVGIQPLLTALIAGAVLKETVTPRHWAGLITGLAGIALVLSPKLNLANGGVNAGTLGASVIAVLAVSAGTIWQKRFVKGTDLRGTTACQYLGAFMIVAPMSLLLETGRYTLTGELMFAMIWLIAVLSIGAIFLLMMLIRDGAVSKVASLFYLVPAVTAVMAWALFHETLNAIQIAGMIVTAFGVALATAQPRNLPLAAR